MMESGLALDSERNALAVCDGVDAGLAAAESGRDVVEVRDEAERLAVLARLSGYNRAAVRLTNSVRRAEIKWARLTPKLPGNQWKANANAESDGVKKRQARSFRAAAGGGDPARERGRWAGIDAVVSELERDALESEVPLTRKKLIDAVRGDKGDKAVAEEEQGMLWGVIDLGRYSESDTRAKLIDPMLRDAGLEDRIRREVGGADYVLLSGDYRSVVAVIEAKREGASLEVLLAALEQGNEYRVRFPGAEVYATDGRRAVSRRGEITMAEMAGELAQEEGS